MNEVIGRRSAPRIGWLQIAIIALTLITAVVHLQTSIMTASFPPGGPSILSLIPLSISTLFLLNFVAYIVLGVALYLPFLRPYQRIIRWLLIALAAVTIIAYFLILGIQFNLLGYFDKAIEVALIVLLLIEERQATTKRIA